MYIYMLYSRLKSTFSTSTNSIQIYVTSSRVACTIHRNLLQDGERIGNIHGPLPLMTNLRDGMAADQPSLGTRPSSNRLHAPLSWGRCHIRRHSLWSVSAKSWVFITTPLSKGYWLKCSYKESSHIGEMGVQDGEAPAMGKGSVCQQDILRPLQFSQPTRD